MQIEGLAGLGSGTRLGLALLGQHVALGVLATLEVLGHRLHQLLVVDLGKDRQALQKLCRMLPLLCHLLALVWISWLLFVQCALARVFVRSLVCVSSNIQKFVRKCLKNQPQ